KVHDDGTGAKLYAAGGMEVNNGQPMRQVGFWDGQTWSVLDGAFDGGGYQGTVVYALESYDDGHGPQLYAGGTFDFVNGTVAQNIARWDGQQFHALAHGQGLVGDEGYQLASLEDTRGSAIYVAGDFVAAGGVAIDGLARWNGESWENVGPIADDVASSEFVYVLRSHHDADGGHVYVGGPFTRAGEVTAYGLARYDGEQWESVNDVPFDDDYRHFDESPIALEFFDDGGGEALYIGGCFRTRAGQTLNHIAKRVGTTWEPLGSGFSNPNDNYSTPYVPIVTDLQIFDDGHGAALYACGWFRDSGTTRVNGVARWDGQRWQALGSGLTFGTRVAPLPNAMVVHDDGNGPALYVMGQFDRAGGLVVTNIARWNGSAWSTVGNITSSAPIYAALSMDLGDGPALYASPYGAMRVDGVDLRGLVRWKDGAWNEFAGGMRGGAWALLGRQEADGPALYAAGSFSTVGPADAPIVSANFARYGCISTVNRGDLNCDGLVNAYDIDAFVLAMQDAARYADTYPDCRIQNADTNADGAVNNFDIDSFVALLAGE
ncbi:MAG: hypothetical protein JNG88_15215, partial [Phycisphaerales bacterium]|nr:hypothetical protein [Phycisphaerales bacterium]